MASKKKQDSSPSLLTVEDNESLFGDFFVSAKSEEELNIMEDSFFKPNVTKVDMFNQFEYEDVTYKPALQSILDCDYKYVQNMPLELQKKYSSLILMRFLTSPTDRNMSEVDKRYRLIDINDRVNVDLFNLGTEHVALQHMLLCSSVLETKSNKFHSLVKSFKSDTHKLIKSYYPHLTKLELDIVIRELDTESLTEFLKSKGCQDVDIKKHISSWKKTS